MGKNKDHFLKDDFDETEPNNKDLNGIEEENLDDDDLGVCPEEEGIYDIDDDYEEDDEGNFENQYHPVFDNDNNNDVFFDGTENEEENDFEEEGNEVWPEEDTGDAEDE